MLLSNQSGAMLRLNRRTKMTETKQEIPQEQMNARPELLMVTNQVMPSIRGLDPVTRRFPHALAEPGSADANIVTGSFAS